MRKIFPMIAVLAIAVAATETPMAASTTGPSGKKSVSFSAGLSGAQEVPGVATSTRGSVKLTFNKSLSKATFAVRVKNGQKITQAHFHCGKAGTNGADLALLFGFVEGGVDVDGVLTSGTLRNADINHRDAQACGVPINNIASLAFAALDGNIYVNVHSVANPPGEVRGQLLPG